MNNYDSRPPIFGREVTSTFKEYPSIKHKPPGNIRTCWIPPIVFGSILFNLPKLLKLRFYLKKERKKRAKDDIRVAYYSDCLDETNGIANNLRHVISYMRKHNMKAALIGNAFNTRSRGVIENGYCILLPRLFSMEQLGYANSELAIPRISPILRFIKRYPIDLLELETPSPGAWVACLAAKVAGIKTISHYRTDVPTYTRTLVKAKWMHVYVLWLMRIFYWMARPVISPSEDYAKVLEKELKVPKNQIQILPRGLPLDNFSPNNRGKGYWEKFGGNKPLRFAFIGRISKEKNLPFLINIWKKFAAKHDDVELLFVGYGWYLEELKKNFADSPEVHFAGEQGGETLAGLYADADFFLFPSVTDTFGNVVVEAMASGTPALVSDYGGPRSIVNDETNGFILPIKESTWLEALEKCRLMKLEQQDKFQELRKNAFKRSRRYTLENSAKAQFEYFKKVLS